MSQSAGVSDDVLLSCVRGGEGGEEKVRSARNRIPLIAAASAWKCIRYTKRDLAAAKCSNHIDAPAGRQTDALRDSVLSLIKLGLGLFRASYN